MFTAWPAEYHFYNFWILTMTDNLKIRRPLDAKKINVNESWELDYWTKTLNVSADRLRQAVHTVGTMVDDVKRHLGIR
jgi:hypothetical protein